MKYKEAKQWRAISMKTNRSSDDILEVTRDGAGWGEEEHERNSFMNYGGRIMTL